MPPPGVSAGCLRQSLPTALPRLPWLQAQASLDAARCSRPTPLGRGRGAAATNPAEELATKRHKESQKETAAGEFIDGSRPPAVERPSTETFSPYLFLCILVPFCGCLNCFLLFSSALRAVPVEHGKNRAERDRLSAGQPDWARHPAGCESNCRAYRQKSLRLALRSL